jgi:hypothetical protein
LEISKSSLLRANATTLAQPPHPLHHQHHQQVVSKQQQLPKNQQQQQQELQVCWKQQPKQPEQQPKQQQQRQKAGVLQPAGQSTIEPMITWSPFGWPRHALLPDWHWDMLADHQRNYAYYKALR